MFYFLPDFLFSSEDYMLPCLNKKILGFDCMGCGIQRSVVLIFKGDFIGAFKMYPAIYTLILLLSYIILNYFKKFKNGTKIITILAILNVAIILISYSIKMYFN